MITCKKVMRIIEEFAPKELAAEWDNVGLQVGNPEGEVKGILVTLDVTEEVLDEAISLGANMIVSHHPLVFKPLKNLRYDSPTGRLVAKAVQSNIHIYAAHTNADNTIEGVNQCLARRIGLKNTQVLKRESSKLYKLVVYVPEGFENTVRTALGDAGAGRLGDYSYCSFMTSGTGSFKPLEGANPFIGTQGRLEEVPEYRIETVVPEAILHSTISKMLQVHPYEEPAYDVFLLENQDARYGLGRIGELEEPMELGCLAEKVKEDLDCPWVLVSGTLEAVIRRAAICGGAGADLIYLAKSRNADVLVTGDVKYHEAMTAKELGLSIIDAGHNATERVFIPELAEYLRKKLNTQGEEIDVYTSTIDTNPWTQVIG
jgi:dinuclear metal center YbgI/SA1388 family protein